MQQGDRLIVSFVHPLAVGEQFTAWPLHLTIVPWFRAEASTVAITGGLSKALKAQTPFKIKMADQAAFGYGGRKIVRLVDLPNPIVAVEQKVRMFLKAQGAWIADETTKIKRPFRPHITNQRDVQLEQGDEFECRVISIVEQKGSYKEVVGEVTL